MQFQSLHVAASESDMPSGLHLDRSTLTDVLHACMRVSRCALCRASGATWRSGTFRRSPFAAMLSAGPSVRRLLVAEVAQTVWAAPATHLHS